MQQTNYGMTLSLLLATTLLISGCTGIWSKPEKEIVVETKIIEKNIPTVPHPKQVKLHDVKIYVVHHLKTLKNLKKNLKQRMVVIHTLQFQLKIMKTWLLILQN